MDAPGFGDTDEEDEGGEERKSLDKRHYET
jgi:hypothetical protein